MIHHTTCITHAARRRLISVSLAALLAVPASLSAQTVSSTNGENKDEAVKLDKFVVTGSLIPIAADTPAVPITVLTAADIEKSGVSTDLMEVLKKTQPYFYGANNVGADNGNISSGGTNGGSALALRNRATLVLVNGRRMAISPVIGSGGGNFVDVSLIPFAAVERVEVLADGASATYGSDAVSGVVNVILKTNYNGVEVAGGYYWSPNDGNWANRTYSLVAGASAGKTSVTFSTEWKKSDPLIQFERPWALNQFRTPSFAGVINPAGSTNFYYLNPSLNAPPLNQDLTLAQAVAAGIYSGPYTQDQVATFFDLAYKPTMLLGAERRSFTVAVNHQLTDTTRLFADLIYTANDTESVLNAQPVSGNVAASNQFNPFDITVTARNRFVSFPRRYQTETRGMRGVLGVQGNLSDKWTYDAAANFNRTVQHWRNPGLIDANTYTALLNAGTFNPFARVQSAGVIEQMQGTGTRDYTSELNGFDLRLSGELFSLPAGPLQVGLGLETRWESLTFENDRFEQTGQWLGATPRLPFAKRSTADGYFAEARVPIFSPAQGMKFFNTLELSIAARKDVYSSTTDPFVPKYSLRWMPFNDELAIRGTYSESFTAPTLFQLYGPTTTGFTGNINMSRYDTNGTPLNVLSGNRQFRSRGGSNPGLDPSESRNWTAGVVWSPRNVKNFSMSLDWFNIDERDLIGGIGSAVIAASVEQLGAASPYASLVRLGPSLAGELHFDDGAPITTPGQITNRPSDEVWISGQSVNIAGVWQSGADLELNYAYDLATLGRLAFKLNATYINEYYTQNVPTAAPTDFSDSYSGASVYPRWRSAFRADWTYKNLRLGVFHTYIPSMVDLGAVNPSPVAAYSQFDFQAAYSFTGSTNKWLQGLSLTIGVNNAFNEEPPFIFSEGNQSHDIVAYDPIGRMFYVTARYRF
jgi:iron complex outermembrane receptor protein